MGLAAACASMSSSCVRSRRLRAISASRAEPSELSPQWALGAAVVFRFPRPEPPPPLLPPLSLPIEWAAEHTLRAPQSWAELLPLLPTMLSYVGCRAERVCVNLEGSQPQGREPDHRCVQSHLLASP